MSAWTPNRSPRSVSFGPGRFKAEGVDPTKLDPIQVTDVVSGCVCVSCFLGQPGLVGVQIWRTCCNRLVSTGVFGVGRI